MVHFLFPFLKKKKKENYIYIYNTNKHNSCFFFLSARMLDEIEGPLNKDGRFCGWSSGFGINLSLFVLLSFSRSFFFNTKTEQYIAL